LLSRAVPANSGPKLLGFGEVRSFLEGFSGFWRPADGIRRFRECQQSLALPQRPAAFAVYGAACPTHRRHPRSGADKNPSGGRQAAATMGVNSGARYVGCRGKRSYTSLLMPRFGRNYRQNRHQRLPGAAFKADWARSWCSSLISLLRASSSIVRVATWAWSSSAGSSVGLFSLTSSGPARSTSTFQTNPCGVGACLPVSRPLCKRRLTVAELMRRWLAASVMVTSMPSSISTWVCSRLPAAYAELNRFDGSTSGGGVGGVGGGDGC